MESVGVEEFDGGTILLLGTMRWLACLLVLLSLRGGPRVLAADRDSDSPAAESFRRALHSFLRIQADPPSEDVSEFQAAGTISFQRFAGRECPEFERAGDFEIEELIRGKPGREGLTRSREEWVGDLALLYAGLLSEHLPVRYDPERHVLYVDVDALKATENAEWPSMARAGSKATTLLARFAARKIRYAQREWNGLVLSGPIELENMAWSRMREDVLATLDVIREMPREHRQAALEALIPSAPIGQRWQRRRNCLLELEFLDVVLCGGSARDIDQRWIRRDRLAGLDEPISPTWLLDELQETPARVAEPRIDSAKLRSLFRRVAADAWKDGRACIDNVGGPVSAYCLDLPGKFPFWYKVGIGDGVIIGSSEDLHLRKGSIWSPRGRPLLAVMAGELERSDGDPSEDLLRSWSREAPAAELCVADPGSLRWAVVAGSKAELARGDVCGAFLQGRRYVFFICDSGGVAEYREFARRVVLEAAGVLGLDGCLAAVVSEVLALETK